MTRAWTAGVVTVALTALAFAAAAQTASRQTTVALAAQPLHHTANLAPQAYTSFVVTCPKGYWATSGGVTGPVFGTVALKSAPSATGVGWQFRFLNKTAQQQTVTVVVTCVKARPLKIPKLSKTVVPPFPVKSVKAVIATLGAGEKRAVSVTCPKTMAPVGSGYDLQPGGKLRFRGRASADEPPAVTTSRPVHGGWEWTVEGGTTPGSVALYASCGPRTVTARRKKRRARRSVTVTRSLFTEHLHSGSNRIEHSCASGVAVGAGYSLPLDAPIEVHGVAADSIVTGVWWLFVDLNGLNDVAIETSLLCAR